MWKDNNPNSGAAEVHISGDNETNKLVDALISCLKPSPSKASFANPPLEREESVPSDSSFKTEAGSAVHQDKEVELRSYDDSCNFYPEGNGFEQLANKIVNSTFDYLRPLLSPVKVDYSNEILADQLNFISIILFIMSIFIIVLLVAFMFNIIVFVYSDKISNYFQNKYIKWYINFNKKIIGIELFFLGSTILYFMFTLSYGIHFLATHPIVF